MCAKKTHFFGRAVEGSFLSKAGPKRGCFSYLITISVILHKSNVSFLIIAIRCDDHPLFGPAVDKNQLQLHDQKRFFLAQKSGDLFFSIMYESFTFHLSFDCSMLRKKDPNFY